MDRSSTSRATVEEEDEEEDDSSSLLRERRSGPSTLTREKSTTNGLRGMDFVITSPASVGTLNESPPDGRTGMTDGVDVVGSSVVGSAVGSAVGSVVGANVGIGEVVGVDVGSTDTVGVIVGGSVRQLTLRQNGPSPPSSSLQSHSSTASDQMGWRASLQYSSALRGLFSSQVQKYRSTSPVGDGVGAWRFGR